MNNPVLFLLSRESARKRHKRMRVKVIEATTKFKLPWMLVHTDCSYSEKERTNESQDLDFSPSLSLSVALRTK